LHIAKRGVSCSSTGQVPTGQQSSEEPVPTDGEKMKLITRDTDYAIRALCYIAKNKNALVSVSQLVKELSMPRPFLRKILQVLNRKKFLRSYKGLGGGFKLNIPAEKIFLLGLMEVFQGPCRLSEHTFKNTLCPHTRRCRLKKRLDAIEKYVIKNLKDISIFSIINQE
jgi:Rrf2 family protein